ncbi:unnamed protein product [Lymnaea stagnalis]|uniref:Protein quiver n=1 Tax=Lymnaea stagnalis TaxID=6523 RepID=A0AAV2IHZ8_LYMST
MNKQKYFCFMIVLLPAFIETALALSCYQCDSTLDSNCQEMWDSSLSYNQQKYRTCNMWNAQFCIKVTGMWGGVVGTHRFCSSRDLGDQCQDIWFPDHDRMYRACIYTCTGDGCNSAVKWSTTPALIVCLFSAVIAVLRIL